MLFQKIYNWIKYKTLPASFLFRNRLFVERDSKNKRIFSNFGTHFKGSKWRTYLSYSIKLLFRPQYVESTVRFLLYLLVTVVFCLYSKYYAQMPLLNSFLYLVWAGADCAHYYLSFVAWWLILGWFQAYKLYLYYSNFNNFSKAFHSNFLNQTTDNFQIFDSTLCKKKFISKEDVDFYSNLWSQKTNLDSKHILFYQMFVDKVKDSDWQKKHNFFKNNHSSQSLLSKTLTNVTNFSISWKIEKTSTKNHHKVRTLSFKFNLFGKNFFLNFSISTENLEQLKNHLVSFHNQHPVLRRLNRNFPSITAAINRFGLGVRNKLGLFFLKNNTQKDSLDLELSTNELKSFEQTVKNISSSAKISRWLYRYSLTHRKSVKFINKISSSKRTALWPHRDRNYFSKNLWNLKTLNNKNNLNFFFNFKSKLLTDVWYDERSIRQPSLINFYENSFLWLLKKFYFFNSSANTKFITQFSPFFTVFSPSITDTLDDVTLFTETLNFSERTFSRINRLYMFNRFCAYSEFPEFSSSPNDSEFRLPNNDIFSSSADSSLFYDNLVRIVLLGDNSLNTRYFFTFVNYNLSQKTFDNSSLPELVFDENFNKNSVSFLPYVLNVENRDICAKDDLIIFLNECSEI